MKLLNAFILVGVGLVSVSANAQSYGGRNIVSMEQAEAIIRQNDLERARQERARANQHLSRAQLIQGDMERFQAADARRRATGMDVLGDRHADQRLSGYRNRIGEQLEAAGKALKSASQYERQAKGVLRAVAPVALAAGAIGLGATGEAEASALRVNSEGSPAAVAVEGSSNVASGGIEEEALKSSESVATVGRSRGSRTAR